MYSKCFSPFLYSQHNTQENVPYVGWAWGVGWLQFNNKSKNRVRTKSKQPIEKSKSNKKGLKISGKLVLCQIQTLVSDVSPDLTCTFASDPTN